MVMYSFLKSMLLIIIRLPHTIRSIFTWSISLQINIWLLIVLLALMLVAVYLVILEKFVTEYDHCQQTSGNTEKYKKKPFYCLYSRNLGSNGFIGFYDDFLANFLSKTTVFGDLNTNAFHEILRHAYLKRLPEGYVLDEVTNGSLCFVVRGTLELLSKSNNCTLIEKLGHGDAVSCSSAILKAFSEAHKERLTRRRCRSVIPELTTTSRRGSMSTRGSPTENEYASGICATNWEQQYLDLNKSLAKNPKYNTTALPIAYQLHQQYYYNSSLEDILLNIAVTTNQQPTKPNFIARASLDSLLLIVPKTILKKLYCNYPMSAKNIIVKLSAHNQQHNSV